jgi:TonB family protein
MAPPYPTPGSEETGSKRTPKLRIVAGVAVLLAVGAGAFFFLGGPDKPQKKKATPVHIMPVLPPPPPPPTPPPTPPPAPPDPVEPPPDAPEFVEEAAPDSPPEPEPEAPAPMGSNIQGDGPPDGFGLVGKGGGGMIGGRGTGGGGNASRFGWYAGRVQNTVSAAVRSHKTTRSARLTVKARIWVDRTGRVTRASLEGSSGDPEIDRALQGEILAGIHLPDPPPEDMPMPIVMRISAARP